MMSVAEQALMAVSGFVVIAGLLGMLSSLLTSLQERRREMAILRAMGARPRHVFLCSLVKRVYSQQQVSSPAFWGCIRYSPYFSP